MDFINGIPNWIRWLFVPIVSILTIFIAHWVTLIIYRGDNLYLTTIGQGLIGFSYIWAGVLMAPQGKKITALVLFAIFIILGLITLQTTVHELGLIMAVSGFIGCGIGVYCTFEEKIGSDS